MPEPANTRRIPYRGDIDGLRAIAVLSVIFYHARVPGFSGGFVGVDVFFVISGFLITGIILRQLDSRAFSILGFYERRARRILPALLGMVALTLPFAWYLLTPSQMADYAQSIVATLLFASNVLFLRESGYFEADAHLKPLLHTWSLSVEEQFYLVFPVLVLATSRLRGFPIKRVLAGAALLSFAFCALVYAQYPDKRFYLGLGRVWEFMLGSLASCIDREVRTSRWRSGSHPILREVGSGIALGLVAWPMLRFHEGLPHPSWPTLMPVMGTACFLLLASPRTRVGSVLASPVPRGIGVMSFSLYLYHQPVLGFAEMATGSPVTGVTLLAVLGFILAISYVSYKAIETPFRSALLGTRRVLAILACASAGLAGFGLVGHLSGGYKAQRLSGAQMRILEAAKHSPLRQRCHASDRNDFRISESCVINPGPTTVAVFGDSHAVELAFALADGLAARRTSVLQLSRSGCPPSAVRHAARPADRCAEWTREAASFVTSRRDLSTVVISYRLHFYLFGGHEKVYPDLPDTVHEAVRQERWRALVELAAWFAAQDKAVILVLQAPELPHRLEDVVMRSPETASRVAGVSRAWWDRRSAWVRGRLHELPPATLVLDPAESLCDAASCYAVMGGQAMYFDNNHLSVLGASTVASAIIPMLVERGTRHR